MKGGGKGEESGEYAYFAKREIECFRICRIELSLQFGREKIKFLAEAARKIRQVTETYGIGDF